MSGTLIGLSRTQSRTFERSKNVSSTLIGWLNAFDKINTLSDFVDFVEKVWIHTQTQKMLTLSETMRHRMRMFDTVLERPKVIRFVVESHRNILVMLGNIWSTSVDPIVD